MAAPADVLTRIDEIESELRGLSVEEHDIRTIVTQAAVAPVPPLRVADPLAGDRPAHPAGRPGSATRRCDLCREDPPFRGRADAALDELERAIAFSLTDRVALRRLDRSSRASPAISPPCARVPLSSPRRQASLRSRPRKAPHEPVGGDDGDRSSRHPRRAAGDPPRPAIPAKPARTRRSAAQLAADWDLLGPRGFAIIGGAVTAFGSSCSSCWPRTAAGSRL